MANVKREKKDKLDEYLTQMDDPEDWRKLDSSQTPLTREELNILYKLQQGNVADLIVDQYSPAVDFFTQDVRVLPLSSATIPKRRFIPSKSEGKMVMKLVNAIRKGWIKIKDESPAEIKIRHYNLWKEGTLSPDHLLHIPPPKLKLPGHRESIRPPLEYLPTETTLKKWKALESKSPSLGKKWIPTNYDCLRHVPAYQYLLQERFSRCLDLYLCPRVKKNRLQIDPESLVPKLPDSKDLRPFPNVHSTNYKGHSSSIRCMNMDPSGHWLASGSEDGRVCLFEIQTTRCLKTWQFSSAIRAVSWNPNKSLPLLAIAYGDKVVLLSIPVVHIQKYQETCDYLSMTLKTYQEEKKLTTWKLENIEGLTAITITCREPVTSFSWHKKGDYFVTTSPKAANSAILVHQLSKAQSQNPFKRVEGLVVTCQFHPSKSLLFIASTRAVRIYDLSKQEMVKKLEPSAKLLSSLSVHPKGDNVIVGSLDKAVAWFDLDLSSKPYKSLGFHSAAIRDVQFHPRYPLFATCSDDATIHICHGMVYDDLLQNPLIVPVKILHPEGEKKTLWTCSFHPFQPWLFAAGDQCLVHLFTPTVY